MMKQYHEVKRRFPGKLVFFRLGDFYEMFYEDAVIASRELEITLTSRNKDKGGAPIPMCGVPYHSVDGYIARKTGQASRVGDFMDHTLDRFSDIVIFLSIIYSPYIAHRIFGYLALVSILLLSCIGQEGKALGVPREFISPASRIIRMFILMTAPLIVFVLLKLNIEYIIANYTFFDLLMILFIFLACISIIMRAWMILRGVKLNP